MGNDLHLVDLPYSYVNLLEGKIYMVIFQNRDKLGSIPVYFIKPALHVFLQPSSRFQAFPFGFQGQQKNRRPREIETQFQPDPYITSYDLAIPII